MRKRLLVPFLIACLGLGSCAHVETINPVSQIEYVDLSAESLSIDIGESVILTAYSSDSQDVSWVNGDSSVVQLQINGNNATVIGLAKGTSRITAIRRGKSASCVVTVGGGNAEQPITITLSPSSKEININDEFILTASVSGSNNAVTFSSSNTTVASVEAKDDKTARVKGLSEGMATIIAKVGTKTASCAVTVMDPSGDIYISLDRTSLSLAQGTSESLTATIRPIGAEVTWESNNKSAAAVENGVVYAVAPGNALISAIVKANGESRTATCQVTVTETGGDDNYDEQIANWSKTGHLYFHYLRKSDSDYDKMRSFIKKTAEIQISFDKVQLFSQKELQAEKERVAKQKAIEEQNLKEKKEKEAEQIKEENKRIEKERHEQEKKEQQKREQNRIK